GKCKLALPLFVPYYPPCRQYRSWRNSGRNWLPRDKPSKPTCQATLRRMSGPGSSNLPHFGPTFWVELRAERVIGGGRNPAAATPPRRQARESLESLPVPRSG